LNVCFSSKQQGNIWVQPGETILFECDFEIHELGPFETDVLLHFETDLGLRTEKLKIQGVGVAPTP